MAGAKQQLYSSTVFLIFTVSVIVIGAALFVLLHWLALALVLLVVAVAVGVRIGIRPLLKQK